MNRQKVNAKAVILNVSICVCTLTLCILAAEGLLRFFGYHPWSYFQGYSHAPGICESHPSIGWQLNPGKYFYSPTNEESHLTRITISAERYRRGSDDTRKGKPEIWIFGCSYSFGWGLDDQETFAAHLTALLPGYHVKNFSVPGYGTLQAFQWFREIQRENKPKVPPIVIYGFATFHEQRNYASFEWLKSVRRFGRSQGFVSLPYARLDRNASLVIQEPNHYLVLPFSSSSSVLTLAQDALSRLSAGRFDENEARDVTLGLISLFSTDVRRIRGRFIVLGLSAPKNATFYSRSLSERGIDYVDASHLGGMDPEMMVPGDNFHPNEVVHRRWALKTAQYVQSLEASKKIKAFQ